MKTFRLNALGIDVPLPRGFTFKEIVPPARRDVPEIIWGLLNKRERKYYDFNPSDNFVPPGFQLEYMFSDGSVIEQKRLFGRRTLNMFYLGDLDPVKKMMVRAHEETHVLEFMGQLSLLEDRVKKGYGLPIPFSEINEPEQIAQIGGAFALLRRGVPAKFIEAHFFPYLSIYIGKK